MPYVTIPKKIPKADISLISLQSTESLREVEFRPILREASPLERVASRYQSDRMTILPLTCSLILFDMYSTSFAEPHVLAICSATQPSHNQSAGYHLPVRGGFFGTRPGPG